MEDNIIHEKLIVTQVVKKFPTFYGTQRFITIFVISLYIDCWAFKKY
jgi:hypothetical protein